VPQSHRVLFSPTDPETVVVSATFGLVVTEDAGASWNWICLEGVPGGRIGFVPPVVLDSAHTIWMATPDGLARGDSLGCAWSLVPRLDDLFIADVIVDPVEAGTMWVLPSEPTRPNRLYHSVDGGERWSEVGVALPDGFLPERVRVAPDHPERLFVSGVYPPTSETRRRGALFRSIDGGASWLESDLELGDDERNAFLLEVQPAGVVYVHIQGEVHDRLVVSEDGGATFRTYDELESLASPVGRPFAFATSSDGALWYGNTAFGLLRAEAGAAGQTVDKDLALACAVSRGTDMYVCADGVADGFSVGRVAATDPASYEPILRFADIARVRPCASAVSTTCEAWWNDLLRDLGRDSEIPDGGVDTDGGASGDSGVDGGVDGDRDGGATRDAGTGATPPDECGCAAGERVGPRSMPMALGLALIVVWCRAHSRRR
jgi:hypothetical protein